MGRPNIKLVMSEPEREQLASIARSRSLPHSLVRRAQIVLLTIPSLPYRDANTGEVIQ